MSVAGGLLGGIGISPDMVKLSRAGIQNRRGKERARKAEAIRDDWDSGSYYALHWDGKQMAGRRHVDSAVELMCIVLI